MIQHFPDRSARIGISLIVPVYNAKDYIEQCLSSIQAQTYSDWECICVDDGSTDDSSVIVEAFSARDNRFRLIKQKNGGPGVARNTGLEVAQGEYFTFADSDDLLHPQMMERLLDVMCKYDADLVVCDYIRFEKEHEFTSQARDAQTLNDDMDVRGPMLLPEMVDWKTYRVHPWGKLYRHVRHGELRFPPLCGPEDAYASFDVYGASTCTVFSRMRLYGYRVRVDALTTSISRYRNYIVGDAEVAIHGDAVLSQSHVSREVTIKIVMTYVMRIFHHLNLMSLDSRLSWEEKKHLMALGRQGLFNVKRCVRGKYSIVPLVHIVPYVAICLKSLWLLVLWQKVRPLIAGLVFRWNDRSTQTLVPR